MRYLGKPWNVNIGRYGGVDQRQESMINLHKQRLGYFVRLTGEFGVQELQRNLLHSFAIHGLIRLDYVITDNQQAKAKVISNAGYPLCHAIGDGSAVSPFFGDDITMTVKENHPLIGL